jgi:thymidylate synthase (FAD)
MKVELTRITENPILAIEEAASNCYNSEATGDGKIMNHCIKSGHTSVTEFCDFTFHIEGVSRALSHQLVRHRMASYAQRSQRYCSEDGFGYVIPPSIKHNRTANSIYNELMDDIALIYKSLQQAGVPNEDARMVLPNACETKIIVTMNIRSLLHFFEERCCNRAQWEIRQMADMMLDICKAIAPNIFAKAGASCVRGKCKEGKMCCGNPKGGN